MCWFHNSFNKRVPPHIGCHSVIGKNVPCNLSCPEALLRSWLGGKKKFEILQQRFTVSKHFDVESGV